MLCTRSLVVLLTVASCPRSPPPGDQLTLPVDWLSLDGTTASWPTNQPLGYQAGLLEHMQGTFEAVSESGAGLPVTVDFVGSDIVPDGAVRLSFDTSGLDAADTYIRATMPSTEGFGCALLGRVVPDCSVYVEVVAAPRLRWINACGTRIDAKFGRSLEATTIGVVSAAVDGQPCAALPFSSDTPTTVSFDCPTSEFEEVAVSVGAGLVDTEGRAFRTLDGHPAGSIQAATKDLLIARECPTCCGTWIPRL